MRRRQFHGPEKVQEDFERQAILERLGWTFVRIRGSLFFRDEHRALQPVFRRLQELNITPELVTSSTSTAQPQRDVVERVVRRAEELRRSWHPETEDDSESDKQAGTSSFSFV